MPPTKKKKNKKSPSARVPKGSTPPRTLAEAVKSGKRIAMLERRRAALTITGRSGSPLSVDTEAGVIFGAAVMTCGPAMGHGFSVDMTTLQQTCDLGNAMLDGGAKCHMAHPQTQADGSLADQVDKIIGRIRNFRIEGDVLRGDLYVGGYTADRDYILKLAMEDPAACGLSCVFTFDVVPVLGADGMPLPDGGLVARVDELFQIDLVGSPAANRRGLLAAIDPPEDPPAPSPAMDPTPPSIAAAKSSMAKVIAAMRTAMAALREFRDLWAAVDTSAEAADALAGACGRCAGAAQQLINDARGCTDFANSLVPGSIVDEATANTATAVIRSIVVVNDEAYDVMGTASAVRYGSTPLGVAAAIMGAVLRTLLATISDLGDAVRPITMADLARMNHKTADELVPKNATMQARVLAQRCAMAVKMEETGKAHKAFEVLQRVDAASAGGIAIRFFGIRTSNIGEEVVEQVEGPPTREELAHDGNPGAKLLTWLQRKGLNARHVSHGVVQLIGGAAVIAGIPDDAMDLLREWSWSLCEPLDRIEAARLAGLAANATTVEERERLALVALARDVECPNARAVFESTTATMSVYAAKGKRFGHTFEEQEAVPDGMTVVNLQ